MARACVVATSAGRRPGPPATKEIVTRIAQNATKEAVDAIQGITTTIEEVVIAITIGSARSKVPRPRSPATSPRPRGHEDVTTNIGAVTNAAHETGNAASMVLSVASGLSKQAEQLSAK